MVAFIVGNWPTGHSGHKSPEYLVSVDDVEDATGLDFFSELPDSLEWTLESSVAESWPWN